MGNRLWGNYMAEAYSYRKLDVYINAKVLVKAVYNFLRKFPKEENYALCDQLRRSVISVSSNIAEGMGRFSSKEQIHFLEIAYGSLMEVQCQLDISCDLGYITIEEFESINIDIIKIAKQLSGLRSLRIRALNL